MATRTLVGLVEVGDVIEGVDGEQWKVARKMAGPQQWTLQLGGKRSGKMTGQVFRPDAYVYLV